MCLTATDAGGLDGVSVISRSEVRPPAHAPFLHIAHETVRVCWHLVHGQRVRRLASGLARFVRGPGAEQEAVLYALPRAAEERLGRGARRAQVDGAHRVDEVGYRDCLLLACVVLLISKLLYIRHMAA